MSLLNKPLGYAASQLAWPAATNDTAFAALRSSGYTGVELVPAKAFPSWPQVTDEDAIAIKQRCTEYDLCVTAMQAIFFGVSGLHLFQDDAARDNLFNHLLICAKLADILGATTLVFGAPKLRDPGNLETATAYGQAITFFQKLGAALQGQSNAVVTLEPVAPHHGGTFLTTHNETAKFIRDINHPRIRLQFDLGCWIAQQEDLAQLADYAPIIAHSHISAPDLGRIAAPIAAQARACFPILQKAGYEGAISIEMLEQKLAPDWQAAIHEAQYSTIFGSEQQ